MQHIATVQGRRILSDLRVTSQTEHKITFADGSCVLLDSLMIVSDGTEGLIEIEDTEDDGKDFDDEFDGRPEKNSHRRGLLREVRGEIHPEESLLHDDRNDEEEEEDEEDEEDDWGDAQVRPRDDYDDMWDQLPEDDKT